MVVSSGIYSSSSKILVEQRPSSTNRNLTLNIISLEELFELKLEHLVDNKTKKSRNYNNT